ncbi:MAG TPA: DUF1801 domain-containing protein [Burkholderiaceae bacterium]|jgi:hypothetical protein
MRSNLRSSALIETWFDLLSAQQRDMARAAHVAVLAAHPSFASTVKWGNLVYMHGGSNLLALMPHKSHLNLQVFNGAALAERFPQLEGTGKGLRHLKMRYGQEVDPDLIAALVSASVEIAELDRQQI